MPPDRTRKQLYKLAPSPYDTRTYTPIVAGLWRRPDQSCETDCKPTGNPTQARRQFSQARLCVPTAIQQPYLSYYAMYSARPLRGRLGTATPTTLPTTTITTTSSLTFPPGLRDVPGVFPRSVSFFHFISIMSLSMADTLWDTYG